MSLCRPDGSLWRYWLVLPALGLYGAGMLLVRECTAEDVVALEQAMPTGVNDRYGKAFRRQQAGGSSYLVAVRDGVLAGFGEVLWDGCRMADVRSQYPNCPEFNGLSAFPAGQGIGTALIRAAEARAENQGFRMIGLGVAEDNPNAARLYLRLGYQARTRYVDSWSYVDDAGTKHDVDDPATFMVKDLTA